MCALALKQKVAPPTINLQNLAEDCEPLDYTTDEARKLPELRAAMPSK